MTAPPQALDRAFESIAIDEETSFEVTIEVRDIDAFAAVSGDYSPRHMEAVPPFGKRLVHGAHLSSLFSRLVGMMLPGRRCVYLSQQTEFGRPAFPGDLLNVHGRVIDKDEEHRTLRISTTVRRDGVVLASGKAQVMVLDWAEEVRMTLQGKRVIVTGASRGIGRAAATLLAQQGAHVVLGHRSRPDEAEAAVQAIRTDGGRAATFHLELGDRQSVMRFFDDALKELGGCDALVNNAGPRLTRKPAAEVGWDVVARDFEIAVGGTLSCIQRAIPHLMEGEGGAIVNLLSSVTLGVPPPGLASYVTAKSALGGLTRSLAVELGPKKIRVNAVSPGLTDTEMTADIPQLMKNRLGSALPIGRSAHPEDIAGVIAFLCSDAARYMTGLNIPVVGGGFMM